MKSDDSKVWEEYKFSEIEYDCTNKEACEEFAKQRSKTAKMEFYTELLLTVMMVCMVGMAIYLPQRQHEDEPTAMDVYRGYTELHIESHMVNGEITASDTTVVYKTEYQDKKNRE